MYLVIDATKPLSSMSRVRRLHTKKHQHPSFLLLIILLAVLAFLPEPQTSKFQTITIDVEKSNSAHRSANQTIVILPGPHKTGTTSVQAALYQWLEIDHRFSDWAYPVPTKEEFESIHSTYGKMVGGKGFSPMITRLFADPTRSAQEVHKRSPLLQLYYRKIQQAWLDGFNIVIASEHLDRLAVEESNDIALSPHQLWERLVQMLPPYANIEIGINHRTPRIEHLLSMWHQLGKRQETLSTFITKPSKPGLQTTMHSLNTFGLAKFFVKQGYRVKLLDTGAATMDLPAAVVCHVLQIPASCNTSMTERLNDRTDPGERDLDEATLATIDQLLKEYDCQFSSLMKVEWIYGKATFDRCTTVPSKNKGTVSFSETLQAIIEVVCRANPTIKHCHGEEMKNLGQHGT